MEAQRSDSIARVQAWKSRIPLQEPFVISLGTLTHAENVIVQVTTHAGLTGTGECSPFRAINGESMDTGFVVAGYLAAALIGVNPLNIALCTRRMDQAIFGNNSIKSAFDMALYDIAAQAANVPLFQLLGGTSLRELYTDYTVSIGDPAKMAADASNIQQKGFPVIKVKLGGTGEEDVQRIRLIRQAVGPNIPIRIDANQGWTGTEVPGILAALATFNIQHCEEPIPRWDFMSLPAIRAASPIPIMADESCCDHHDARRLLDLKACDRLNVKLGKSGGLFKAQEMLRIAEAENVPVQLGGFLESRLGFTAAAHLALSSSSVQFCDFDTPLMFTNDPVVGGIVYGANGSISIPGGPGLGATFSQQYLQTLESCSW